MLRKYSCLWSAIRSQVWFRTCCVAEHVIIKSCISNFVFRLKKKNQTTVSAKPTLMGTPLVIAQSKAGMNTPAPTSASPARAQTCLLTAEGEPGGSRGLCFLLLSGEGSGCRSLSPTGKAFSQRYFSIVFLLEKEGYVVLLSTILMQKGRMEAIMAWPGQEQVLAKKPALSPYRNHLHR